LLLLAENIADQRFVSGAEYFVSSGTMQQAKHLWQRRYGILGGSRVRRFDERWLDASPEQAADLLDHPDPSALADYSTAYGAVKGMRVVPFGRRALVAVAVVAALP